MDGLSISELTPAGRGAIATLLVRGAHAAQTVARLVWSDPPKAWPPTEPQHLELRWIGPQPAEQVVLRYRSEDVVELHCHGGLAVARITRLLETAGAVRRDWRQSLPVQSDDPIAADALAALLEAPTERAAAILLDQSGGALRAAVARVLTALEAGDTTAALQQVAALRRWTSLGTHLTRPWRVVLAGQPNVGKSSLLNALLGYTRALVHPTPGTTRDVLTAQTAMAGWPVELVDTAGLRAAEHPLEQAGVSLAEQELEEADLVLLVCDGSQPWTEAEELLRCRRPEALIVHNKADLCALVDSRRPAGLAISARLGRGLDAVVEAIAARLVPEMPAPRTAVPFTAAQDAALAAAVQTIETHDVAGAIQGLCEAACFRRIR